MASILFSTKVIRTRPMKSALKGNGNCRATVARLLNYENKKEQIRAGNSNLFLNFRSSSTIRQIIENIYCYVPVPRQPPPPNDFPIM